MALTPNYSFIIPAGTDAVNLLTQCYPNFSSLDTLLKPIQESGVTVATDTKVGTVHQLVRTDSSCNMFRFIATANYASGDTFTVDGASVTATAMDGTALPGGAFVINQSVVCVLNNLVLTVLIAGKETTSLPASSVTYDNTVSGLTATNAQDAIDELQSEISSIPVVTEHGLKECWVNAAPSNAFAGQDITFSSDVEYDALFFEIGLTAGESAMPNVYSIDKLKSSTTVYMMDVGGLTSATYFTFYQNKRTIAVAYDAVNEEYTITFGDGESINKAANSTNASAYSTNNNTVIPYRILGLIHNN